MKLRIVITIAIFSVLLVACGDKDNSAELDAEGVKDLVQAYTVGEAQAKSASITGTELIVTEDNDKEKVYKLPEDDFFVSIAPFINETHPCDIHSLTGCQGELVNQDFDIYIEDSLGNEVLDETKQTEANGFIDLWLPRDETYNVIITQDGKTSESKISTFEDDNTCITTMQLS